jgi:hypothetical protein
VNGRCVTRIAIFSMRAPRQTTIPDTEAAPSLTNEAKTAMALRSGELFDQKGSRTGGRSGDAVLAASGPAPLRPSGTDCPSFQRTKPLDCSTREDTNVMPPRVPLARCQ